MEANYNECHYKARRVFFGNEFEVRLFDVDSVGIAIVIFQLVGTSSDGNVLKFSCVFSPSELQAANIPRTLEGYVTLVDSLELVEDGFFTSKDATTVGLSELTAYQLTSSLPGIRFPPPIVSKPAALAYLTKAPVGLTTWNDSRRPEDDKSLLDVIAKGLTELCRQKPVGLDAVTFLGRWLLENNPSQPLVHVE